MSCPDCQYEPHNGHSLACPKHVDKEYPMAWREKQDQRFKSLISELKTTRLGEDPEYAVLYYIHAREAALIKEIEDRLPHGTSIDFNVAISQVKEILNKLK